MYILDVDVWGSIKDFFKGVKDFFWSNYNNPFLWLGIVAIILGIFYIAYNSLHGRD